MRWLLVIGFVSGMLFVISPHFSDVQQFCEEERIAIHLARGEGYLSPFDLSANAPPTSWCPPVYPIFVAAVYRLSGIRSDTSLMVLLVAQVLLRAAAAGALFQLGSRLFSRTAGVLAACLFLLHPLFLRALGFYWDNYLALSVFLWLLAWSIHLGERKRTLAQACNFGFALGILALTNTAYVLTFPVLALLAGGWIAVPRRGDAIDTRADAGAGCRAGFVFVCVAALATIATLEPWTIRNYLTFGEIFFVRANLNTELLIGNGPESAGWMTFATIDLHPSRNRLEQEWLLRRGEIGYFADCGRRFDAEYRAAPSAFWSRCRNRVVYAFLGDPASAVREPFMLHWIWHGMVIDRLMLNALLAMFGIAGAWAAWRMGQRAGMILLLLACLSVAPYVFTQMYDRYTLPLTALLLLPASYLITAVGKRWAEGRWPDQDVAVRAIAASA